MDDRLQVLRERMVESVPSVSITRTRLVTESMMSTEDEPVIIQQAKALAHVLRKMPIEILENELVVGKIVEDVPGAAIYPEAHGTRVIPELEDLRIREPKSFSISDEAIALLEDEIGPYWAEKSLLAHVEKITPPHVIDTLYSGAAFVLTEMAGYGHVSINYPLLFSKGFEAIASDSGEKLEQLSPNDEQFAFYKSSQIVASALIHYARRYAALAKGLSQKETDARRKKELESIAEICEWVPANPPRTFYEAIQFIRFTHLALSLETYDGQAVSLGRIDQYLYPFFKRDIDKGILDLDSARTLVESLWIKLNELVPLFDALVAMYFEGLLTTQAVTIGGISPDASDVTNQLTFLILEATKNVALPLPNVHVRIHSNTPKELLNAVVSTIESGVNNIALFNDDVIVRSMERKGVSSEDAKNYATVGCVELAPFGNSFTSSDAALFNIALCLELALNNGEAVHLGQHLGTNTGDIKAFKSMDDVVDAFRKQVSFLIHQMVEGSNSFEQGNIDRKPTPLLSLCVEGCFEQGADITRGSAKYNFTGVQGVGLASVADSLAAIDQLVFGEKRITLEDLVASLREGLERNDALRQMLATRGPKYGNDDELADEYAQLVARIYSEEVEKHANLRGGWFIPGMYSVSTHVPFGYMTGALPSGRVEGTPLSNGASPALGSTRKGLTAAIVSASKIDYTMYPNGIALTLSVDPAMASGDGAEVLTSLIQSFVQLGGMQIQFNITEVNQLRKAQKNPDAYRDLLVRVAGYSAYFTDLGADMQDEVIGRFQRSR
ncbi:MAG: formate C-acetyltransferase/glycerol dehydratase family glycyl radical enzyme [Candidatus Thorarchaeota archaeon]